MNSRLLELSTVAIIMVLGFILTLRRAYSVRSQRQTHKEQQHRDEQLLDRLQRVLP